MKKYLSLDNINTYKDYTYFSEDNTFLTQKYRVFWNFIQKFIPKYVHPNIITLFGLISIIFGHYMMKTYSSNITMGICVWLYLNFDGLDGIHARKTNNTSIIGEYLDHIIDLINTGLIVDCLSNQLGLNLMYSNIFAVIISCGYITTHYESVVTGKIKFEGATDVSLLLTLITMFFIFGIKFPDILLNNNYFLSGILALIFTYNMYKLYNFIYQDYKNNGNLQLGILIVIWYLFKYVGVILNCPNHIWTITIIDIILLLEIINYKIFKKRLCNFLYILPGIFSFNPLLLTPIVINYFINCISKIASELKINMLKVEDKKLRVFCCGVFDMCHLGHMMLFKKISDSFDVPIKLIVGVHSDSICADYKREPIINENLRYRTVELCKYVDEIVENFPLIVTKELIDIGNYDVVIIGEEYRGNKDTEWYPGAIELNKYKYISRFTDISTSDIIKKVKSL